MASAGLLSRGDANVKIALRRDNLMPWIWAFTVFLPALILAALASWEWATPTNRKQRIWRVVRIICILVCTTCITLVGFYSGQDAETKTQHLLDSAQKLQDDLKSANSALAQSLNQANQIGTLLDRTSGEIQSAHFQVLVHALFSNDDSETAEGASISVRDMDLNCERYGDWCAATFNEIENAKTIDDRRRCDADLRFEIQRLLDALNGGAEAEKENPKWFPDKTLRNYMMTQRNF